MNYLVTRANRNRFPSLFDWGTEIENIFNADRSEQGFWPACDIVEDNTEYQLHLEIPGFSKDDIEIEFGKGSLTVKGKREQVSRNYLRQERKSYEFQRSFSLPENVNEEGITAKVNHGVLDITLPKVEKSSRKISIEG